MAIWGLKIWFFSNLVGEEDSRILGLKGSRVQGLAVKYYSFTFDVLDLRHPQFLHRQGKKCH